MLERFMEALETKGYLERGGKRKLAKISGYSPGAVSDFLSGKQILGDKFVRSVCRELGISEYWVRTGEGTMFDIELTGTERSQMILDNVMLAEQASAANKKESPLESDLRRLVNSMTDELLSRVNSPQEELDLIEDFMAFRREQRKKRET